MIAAPNMAPCSVTAPVSTIDVCPTLCDLAGISMAEVMPWTRGESLVPMAAGRVRGQPVAMEYAAEASYAPIVSLCSGWWKYTRCALDPEQLFELETDPHELTNLASHPQHKKVLYDLRDQSHALLDLVRSNVELRESQARRWVIYKALREGRVLPLGLSTASKSLRALHAQPYGSQHARGLETGSQSAVKGIDARLSPF